MPAYLSPLRPLIVYPNACVESPQYCWHLLLALKCCVCVCWCPANLLIAMFAHHSHEPALSRLASRRMGRAASGGRGVGAAYVMAGLRPS